MSENSLTNIAWTLNINEKGLALLGLLRDLQTYTKLNCFYNN